jgi:hypothetical protein
VATSHPVAQSCQAHITSVIAEGGLARDPARQFLSMTAVGLVPELQFWPGLKLVRGALSQRVPLSKKNITLTTVLL